VQCVGGLGSTGRAVGVEQAFLQHVPGAVEPFLARLEHEQHVPGQLGAALGQQPGGRRQHRGVGVVAARMHRPVDVRGERQAGVLAERQGVHVAAQQHRRARPVAVEDGDHGRHGAPQVHPQRQVGQLRDDGVARAGEVQSEFRMAMQRPPQRHRARLHGASRVE
jgi:hypothetical protein